MSIANVAGATWRGSPRSFPLLFMPKPPRFK
jgi:hypothetical protein